MKVLTVSTASDITVVTSVHASLTIFLKSSLVLYKSYNTKPRPAIIPIAIPIGPPSKPRTLENKPTLSAVPKNSSPIGPNKPLSPPNTPVTLPIGPIIDPNIHKTGPTAAAIAPHLVICSCCSVDSSLNLSTSLVIHSAKSCINGVNAVPIAIPALSNAPLKFSTAPAKPLFIVSAISCAAPSEFCNELTSLENCSGDPFTNANIPLIASWPNNVAIACCFCSSVIPLKLFCKSPIIVSNGFI